MVWRWDRASIQYTVLVEMLSGDGSVLVHHSGVEMGQGINTKVCQYTVLVEMLSGEVQYWYITVV